MPRICIVVAEQSKARFFIQDGKAGKINEMADLVNMNARKHEQDLLTDRPGRSFDSKGSGRHAMETKTNARKQYANRFATEICDYLEKNSNRYDNLVIISPPGFLGYLRKKMPDTLAKLVTREIKKNFVQEETRDIEQFLIK